MLHIYVLDYTLGEMWHFTCNIEDDVHAILESHHIDADACYWMATEREINIQELE